MLENKFVTSACASVRFGFATKARLSFGLVFGVAALINFALPGLAQLPPTNMGKFVHQPGDNQYSDATQRERHPVAPPPQFRQGARMMLMPAAPATPQVDVSIEPIACDEPIPIAGFPPLPDRLELPVQEGGSWSSKKSSGGSGGTGGDVTFHQHYGHVPMSTFAKPKTLPGAQQEDSEAGEGEESQSSSASGGSGGGVGYYKARTAPVITRQGSNSGGGSVGYYKAGNAPVMIQQNNGSVGYYKAGSVQPMTQQGTGNVGYYKARPQGGDVYNTNNAGGGAPQYGGASDKDLKALGKEPKLGPDGKPQIDPADSITINQSTTQDLSLPDDTATYKYSGQSPEKSMGKGAAKNMGKMLKGPLSRFGGMGGMHF
jgi:hypothetical protein